MSAGGAAKLSRRRTERYEAMDGTAVHAECMEALLLETVGVEALAERMGYEHRREVEMDAERREGL